MNYPLGCKAFGHFTLTSQLKGEPEMKEGIQRLGGFVAGMIAPSPGAFIAWGLTMDNLTTV